MIKLSAIPEPRASLLHELQEGQVRNEQREIGENIRSADPDMAEADPNNWEEDVRKLVRERAEHKAPFTEYEGRFDELVADHAVTSEKLCEAEALLFTLQKKYKTILR